MCCLDPNEPQIVRKARATMILQLVAEIVCLILSASSIADGGILGSAAGIVGLIACVVGLCRGIRYSPAFRSVIALNVLATGLQVGQGVILMLRWSSIDDWCCALATTDIEALRTFFIVLVCIFLGLGVLRLAVAICLAMPARKALPPATVSSQIAMGVPVANVVDA